MKRLVTCVIGAVVACVTIHAASTFTSVFKAPAAREVSFAGKKVAALVISSDESLRVAGEEAITGELTKRGIQGVATYRIAPREELAAAERAKPWFERAGVEGVVAMRPVSSESEPNTRSRRGPAVHGSLWGYYGYGWGNVVSGSAARETVIGSRRRSSVPRDALLWAGPADEERQAARESSSRNWRGGRQELHKVGLARRIEK